MKKKKVLPLLLTAWIAALLLCITVCAQSNIVSSGTTDVSTEISVSYIVSIPDSTDIEYGAELTPIGTVSASEIRLLPGSYLTVDMASAGKLINASSEDSAIPYTFVIGGKTELTKPAYTFRLDGNTKTAEEISVKIASDAWKAADAGSYSDTITFTVTCIDKAS